MNDHSTDHALNFLIQRWDYILEGAAGADLIGVNRATMRTRIARGQAMAMRDTEGRERGRVEYTPRHLVYNMLYDGLARYNAAPDDQEVEDWISGTIQTLYNEISKGDFNKEALVRAVKREGKVSLTFFDSFDQAEMFTGEPSVFVPIGTMIIRLAHALFAKHSGRLAGSA